MKAVFEKHHGIGNNFIVIDNRDQSLEKLYSEAEKLCDVHFGLGADGVVFIEESESHDIKMRIINADGSEPEMCGNGIRCLANSIAINQSLDKKDYTVETLAGPIGIKEMAKVGEEGYKFQVDMGEPIFKSEDAVFTLRGEESVVKEDGEYFFVSMGNPHAIRFVENYDFDYHKVGQTVENWKESFPKRTNVEFIKVNSDNDIDMRVWERGCGETFACGTGACASVVAGIQQNKLKKQVVKVHLLGGDLEIDWREDKHVYMTGPALRVASGHLHL